MDHGERPRIVGVETLLAEEFAPRRPDTGLEVRELPVERRVLVLAEVPDGFFRRVVAVDASRTATTRMSVFLLRGSFRARAKRARKMRGLCLSAKRSVR